MGRGSVTPHFLAQAPRQKLYLGEDPTREGAPKIGEFPKIRDLNIDPKLLGLLLQGHPEKGHPQFTETAIFCRDFCPQQRGLAACFTKKSWAHLLLTDIGAYIYIDQDIDIV